MTDHNDDTTLFRVLAVVAFVGGAVWTGFVTAWGIWGRLPGTAIMILVAPWLLSRAGIGGRAVIRGRTCPRCNFKGAPTKDGSCANCGRPDIA